MSTLTILALMVTAYAIGGLSALNISLDETNRPSFKFKQILLDAACLICTIANVAIWCTDEKLWNTFADIARKVIPEYSLSGGTILVFCVIVLAIGSVCFYYALHYLSITIQEVKFAYTYRQYERERRAHRAAKKKAEAEKARQMQEAINLMKQHPEIITEAVADMKAGEARIINFPIKELTS